MPVDFDPVYDEAVSFFDRARKAVAGAVATGVTTAAGVIGTSLVADGFSVEGVLAGVAAGALAGLAALKVVYEARNRPASARR